MIIGILGGGQLARMLCMEARRMHIRTLVWTGGLEAPALDVCDEAIEKSFTDSSALTEFLSKANVATVEFENIPRVTLEAVEKSLPLRPSAHAIATCANRELEKNFLRENQIPHAPFWIVTNADELAIAMKENNGAGVLKSSAFGYDGKGQRKISGKENAQEVWQEFSTPRAILEAFIPFERELSVMIARKEDGTLAIYDAVENEHRHHILDLTIAPARVSDDVLSQAKKIATDIVEKLHYVGIMGVEFFLCSNKKLLVNEMAPRPHNSGHHTIDACATSQFEQQLRAVCDFPLGSTELLSPAAMLNLLGDMWKNETQAPDWTPLFADSAASLHLYGKEKAAGRRKMGHATFLGNDAVSRATKIKELFLR